MRPQADMLGRESEHGLRTAEFARQRDADDGTVAAVATVTASNAQTITCSFPTPPEPGTYTLEVACRNGNRLSLAPAVARLRNIVVKAG